MIDGRIVTWFCPLLPAEIRMTRFASKPFQFTRSKIVSPNVLEKRLALQRPFLKRLVFTNGCFDLLHAGHLDYLEKARKKGDALLVAVNSDDSIRQLKGPSRPLQPLERRLFLLAGLACVDYVTWFDTPTPLDLILRFLPEVLVKGGDWKKNQIVGAREVLQRGGKVFSLPLVKGLSTTALIRQAKIAD